MSPRHHVLAALLFAAATAAFFAPVLRAGPARAAALEPVARFWAAWHVADAEFQAFLVARNARTLATRPHRLFDTEHCAPAEDTLAYGIPMVTLGALGIPAALLSDEPVLVYNAAIVLLNVLSAFAMYLLVARWTGVVGAGVVAGLLFGFQPLRLGNVAHPSVWDISWTVFALFFAERLFRLGRWRDAVGTAVAIALQVGASFYPLTAAVFLAPPLLVWLFARHRLRHVRPAQLAFVAGVALLAAAVVLLPYLGAETDAGALARSEFYYLEWGEFFSPASIWFPGWTVLALAACAFAGRRGLPGADGDPRLALCVGALLVLLVAAGPNTPWLPDLHRALSAVLPGLDAVRAIGRLATGGLLALTVLAGLGAGVLIRRAGERGRVVAVALALVAAFDVMRLPALGLERLYTWDVVEIRPDAAAVAFFEALEARGNRGALLELPDAPFEQAPKDILLAAFHRRRTSSCFGSYTPAGRDELARLAAELPADAAVDALTAQGFTTLIVHRRRG
ncbi:MAG: hypothetical protein ACQGVC_22355, partial [Myxococcota bacterium]